MANLELLKRLSELQAGDNGEGSQLLTDSVSDSLKDGTETPDSLPQPNGGLTGQALDEQIDKAPGPVATTGFNPSNPGPQDIRSASLFDLNSSALQNQLAKGNLSSDASRQPAAGPTTPAAPAAVQATSPKATQTPNASIQTGYGQGLGDQDLADAQKNADLTRLIGGLANSGSTIGAALSRGAAKPVQIGDDIIKNADSGVKDLLTRRDAQDKSISHDMNVIQLANEKDKNDPNSSVSQLGKAIATKLSALTGIKLGNIDNASWSSLEKAMPGLERYAGLVEQANARKEATAERLSSKATDKQNNAYKTITQMAESLRGDPAVKQAETDLYNSHKAEDLANLYGDPNKLSPQQVELLKNEVAKIAQGNAPQREELQALSNPAIASKMSSLMQKFTGSPTPANASAFVKQYTDYTSALKKNAQQTILDKYGRLGNGFKPQLGENNYNLFKQQYLDRFNQQKSTTSNSPSDDPRIDAFMKANNITDRNEAMQILKQNGKL